MRKDRKRQENTGRVEMESMNTAKKKKKKVAKLMETKQRAECVDAGGRQVEEADGSQGREQI